MWALYQLGSGDLCIFNTYEGALACARRWSRFRLRTFCIRRLRFEW